MSTFSEERSNDCYQPLGSFFVSNLIIHLLRKKSRCKSHYITFLSSQPMITRVDKKTLVVFAVLTKTCCLKRKLQVHYATLRQDRSPLRQPDSITPPTRGDQKASIKS